MGRPKSLRASNLTKDCLLASDVFLADNFFSRLKGLLFTKSLPEGRGLVLKPCMQIHMFGMSYAIDALFLDRDGVVVGLVEKIEPGRMSPVFWKAKSCLEVPVGTISGTDTKLGDKVGLS